MDQPFVMHSNVACCCRLGCSFGWPGLAGALCRGQPVPSLCAECSAARRPGWLGHAGAHASTLLCVLLVLQMSGRVRLSMCVCSCVPSHCNPCLLSRPIDARNQPGACVRCVHTGWQSCLYKNAVTMQRPGLFFLTCLTCLPLHARSFNFVSLGLLPYF